MDEEPRLPDVGSVEAHCEILETIAKEYAKGSPEEEAIFAAAHAMHFLRREDTRAKFRAWVDSWTQPPTAFQVLMAKQAGIDDLPHELLDETLRDVERLAEKLRHLRQ